MSRLKKYLQKEAIDRVPEPALDMLGKGVLKGIDKAVDERWDEALQRAMNAEGSTVDERVSNVLQAFKRELTAVGAATGAMAAAPGLGTAAAAGALAADLGWFAMRATDMIMTIGALHGHTESSIEERRAWVLAVMAFGEEAAREFSALVSQLDPSGNSNRQLTDRVGDAASARGAKMFGGDMAALEALRRINTNLAAEVVKKYGTRRSALAAGKLLPFGIGAVVGGSANWAFVRAVGKQSVRFFRDVPSLSPQHQSGILSVITGGADDPASKPPPPASRAERGVNPPASLTENERRNAIPVDPVD